ncbi:hypothetical protein [Thermogymnomonas acidicola]|uniref:hypothetical protein n=1 Tax=Thermogymnomonas acidicola TaxID=399579 RepID=UPI001396CF1C|nr:hypothetical protein [Thermogymnomonas acidicola]
MMSRRREQAWWLFSKELKDTTVVEERDEDQRGRPYIVTPLGARVKRVLVCGQVTQKRAEDTQVRLTVSDPLGPVYVNVFASDFNEKVMAEAAKVNVNDYIVVMGRTNVFRNSEGNLYVSVNPEFLRPADEMTRAFWNFRTAHLSIRSSTPSGRHSS